MALIRPIVTRGCEIWTLSVQDVNSLLVFERQTLGRIYMVQFTLKKGAEQGTMTNCRK